MRLKKGDTVKVRTGKDSGKTGKVEKVLPKVGKVVVSGVNIYKRHVRKSSESKPGGIVDITKPLPVANVSLVCPRCGQVTRVGYQVVKKEKTRICRKCKETI
jgi:large subunit ribosomal protein L24